MTDLNFVLLYVASPVVSAAFYADLLSRPPVESSPTFAMFAMQSKVMLGLWARRGRAETGRRNRRQRDLFYGPR
jgi:hypothetical protein